MAGAGQQAVADAFRHGMSMEQVFEYTAIDPWFLVQIEDIVKTEEQVKQLGFAGLTYDVMRYWECRLQHCLYPQSC